MATSSCYDMLRISTCATREEIVSGWRNARNKEKNTARHGMLREAKETALALLEKTAVALEMLKANRCPTNENEEEDFEQYYKNLGKIKTHVMTAPATIIKPEVEPSSSTDDRRRCAFDVLLSQTQQPVAKKKKVARAAKPTNSLVTTKKVAYAEPPPQQQERAPLHESPFLKNNEKECVKEFMAFARGNEGGLHRLKQVSTNILVYHNVAPEQLGNIASFAGLYVDGNTGDYRRVRKGY